MSDLDPALEELDTLLGEIPLEVDAMIVGSVEGLIAGVIVLPRQISNDLWLPLVWGENEAAFPDDPAKSARLIELLLARKTAVIGAFLAGNMTYNPVMEIDLDDSMLWEIWLEGFLKAVDLQPSAPEEWLASENEDVAACAAGIEMLIGIMDSKKPAKRIDTKTDDIAPGLLAHYAETLYRCQRGLARISLD